MPGIYGGDEINAVCIDAGASQTRAGWAGEDTPRVVLPSSYAYQSISDEQIQALEREASFDPMQQDGEDSDHRLSVNRAKTAKKALQMVDREKKRRRFVGDSQLNLWREGAEIASPFDGDGVVTKFPAFRGLCNTAMDELACNPREHPLLMTEPAWNSKEARERMTEIAFESLEVPAFYLANRTVLSSFAAGKPTSLLVDVGANSTSVIPVVDGFVLRKGIQRQDNAGEAINRALLYSLKHKDITPQFQIKSKAPVDPGMPPQLKLREDRPATASFKAYHVGRAINDFKEATAHVFDMPWDEASAALRPTRMYEFPDGYNDAFGIERYRASEVVFTPQLWREAPGVLSPGKNYDSLIAMIMNAIGSSDVDSRPALFANIVSVGGTSFLPGFSDRLSYELGIAAPNQKVKVHAPGNTTERKHSSWLGASILASLGTFHQLWVSRQEYEEHGSAIVHARCK